MDDPESRLRHFHFTRTSNHTCTSLFKVTVLCFSPLSSICLVFSPLTLLTVNWSFIRSFIEHISHTSLLISYHQGFKLTLCLPYRLSHVTAAVHQPRCISTTHVFICAAAWCQSGQSSTPPSPPLAVPLFYCLSPSPPFILLLPSLIWLIQCWFLPLRLSSRWSLPCQAAGPGGGTELRLH